MNISKIIKKKFFFLIERSYRCEEMVEKSVCSELKFKKNEFTIILQFDCRNEFLDLTINENTKILIKTNYDQIVLDNLNWEKRNFSRLLKDIYSISHDSLSLSDKQFIKLINLYAGFIFYYFD